jgi:hypothetical protein
MQPRQVLPFFHTRPHTLEHTVPKTLSTLQCEPTERCGWSTRHECGSSPTML